MNDSTDGPVRVELRPSGAAVVTLALPERRNAMTDAMTAGWVAAMAALRADGAVRSVVVTGEGSAFCAGGDVSWLAAEPDASPDALRTRMRAFYLSWLSIRELEVPTIAAINGPAVGAGLALALACDLRYAADGATMGVPFTALGLHPGMATTWTLPQAVGVGAARELLLTGRMVDAAEAVRLGLVTRAYPADRLLPEVLDLADTVAGRAPIATRLTKVALRDGGHASFATALEWEALAQPVTLATQDLQEGLRAQRERRRPHFTGR